MWTFINIDLCPHIPRTVQFVTSDPFYCMEPWTKEVIGRQDNETNLRTFIRAINAAREMQPLIA